MTDFAPGMGGKLNEIGWRVGSGTKADGDLTLVLFCPTWRIVPMGLGFLFADFFFQNEQRLYPPPVFDGGQRYLNFCQGAAAVGWEAAQAQLEIERRRKAS